MAKSPRRKTARRIANKKRPRTNHIKLSICIATYNRAEFIGATLESIIPQLTPQTELVVVDGASTDNTKEVVQDLAATCKRLRYFRLPKKGGVDQDYCSAVELANGDYVWLFSDDDLFETGAVKRILSELKTGYSALIANARVMDRDLSATLVPAMLEDRVDRVFTPDDLSGLFDRVVPFISFIGCVVVNRRFWQHRDRQQYFGTEFIHVGVLFQAPLPGGAKVIGEPLIVIRYGNAQWTRRASGIWLWKWPRLLKSFDAVAKEARKKKANQVSLGEFKKMIVYRALSSYSYATFKEFFRTSELPAWWKGSCLAVAILPPSLLRIPLRWYLNTFRRDAKETRMTLLDLSMVGRNS